MSGAGWADQPTERELQLMQRIEQLEARLEQLEQRVGEPAAPADLDARVAALEQRSSGALIPSWSNGLRFTSPDKAYDLKLGGGIQWDLVFPDEDREIRESIGELEEGTEFRRARLFAEGTIYERVEYKAEYDFANGKGDAEFKDVYLGLRKLPGIGGIRVGHFKEPFGLEQLTSSKYMTFMERGLPDALVPARNAGIMAHNTALDERLTWQLGYFWDVDNFADDLGSDSLDQDAFTARVVGTPWYEEDGRKLLLVGGNVSYRDLAQEDYQVSSRLEVHTDPKLASATVPVGDDVILLGPQAALVYGPFSAQAEYVRADASSHDGDDADFDSWYVYASYFLTGEHRPYKASSGAFDRVKPKRNFLEDGGWGAWEVGIRYSTLDLEDGDYEGGELDDITVGLNWYLNPNTRVMWNYVHAEVDGYEDVDASADAFAMRFQIDF